jgi:hypothetical protein
MGVVTRTIDDHVDLDLKDTVAQIRGAGQVVNYRSLPVSLGSKHYVGVALYGTACWLGTDTQKERAEQLVGRSEPVAHDKLDEEGDNLVGWVGAKARIKDIRKKLVELVRETTSEAVEPGDSAAAALAKLFPFDGPGGAGVDHTLDVQILERGTREVLTGGDARYRFKFEVKVPKKDTKEPDAPDKWKISAGMKQVVHGGKDRPIAVKLTKCTSGGTAKVLAMATATTADHTGDFGKAAATFTIEGETEVVPAHLNLERLLRLSISSQTGLATP